MIFEDYDRQIYEKEHQIGRLKREIAELLERKANDQNVVIRVKGVGSLDASFKKGEIASFEMSHPTPFSGGTFTFNLYDGSSVVGTEFEIKEAE